MKYSFESIERNERIRDIVCKSPYSIPDKDGIEIFETAEEMRDYLKKEVE